MTTISISIDQQLYEQASNNAKINHCSADEQIVFWAKLGRAALENPDLPISFIEQSLLSLLESHEALESFIPRSQKHEL